MKLVSSGILAVLHELFVEGPLKRSNRERLNLLCQQVLAAASRTSTINL